LRNGDSYLAVVQDGHVVPEEIGLLHGVRREDNDAAGLEPLD
jgi:hypothetical protein